MSNSMPRLIEAEDIKDYWVESEGSKEEFIKENMPDDADYTEYSEFFDKMLQAFKNVVDTSPTIDAEPVVRCKDCIYWQDRKVRMKNGEYRDYLPDEDMFVSIDKGINVGSHCTLHGYENMSGSWFWAQANDFCSRGEKKDKEKSRNDL